MRRVSPGNQVELTGKLSSGSGQLTLNGTTLEDGLLRVKAQGKDFQAADMPGANVIIAPDLTFERSQDRMLLYGQVRIRVRRSISPSCRSRKAVRRPRRMSS